MPCYSEARLDSIRAALESLRRQTLQPAQVIVAVDNCAALASTIEDEFDWATVVLNTAERGASATRNRGAEAVDQPITAFLDDDEVADPDWLSELVVPFGDADVVGTGGRYEAAWAAAKPSWFPDEFAWAVGGSYRGLPTEATRVRNVWSGNMAVRTAAFRSVGGFRTEFGKQDVHSQPEDTDLCIRMATDGAYWVYVPRAVIFHDVPVGRSTFRFFLARCHSEGAGKAAMRANLQSREVLGPEYGFARSAVAAGLRRFGEFGVSSSAQALAIFAGLFAAALGFVGVPTSLRQPKMLRAAAGNRAVKPALIVDYDVSIPVEHFVDQLGSLRGYRNVWVLARQHGRPIAFIESVAAVDAIRCELLDFVSNRKVGAGCPESPPDRPDIALAQPLSTTVVVCTRERPDDLARVLDSLTAQTYREFSLLVVDNAPRSDTTSRVVEQFIDSFPTLTYVVEPRPGLSQARNCAIRHVETDVIAWIDDDEVADENWVAEIVSAFARHPGAAAISGSVIPAELDTWPQWWFEQYGGHSKGRGFTEVVIDPHVSEQSPLYPLPAFGAGANMAIKTAMLSELGGFDVGLGAGTETFGGEDTLMFSRLLLAGHSLVYQPAAMTRHFHRREMRDLELQMRGYGIGLTAFYTALLRENWRLIFPLVYLAPRAFLDMFWSRGSTISGELGQAFPSHLLKLKRIGLILGPIAYIRARRSAATTRLPG